MAKNTSNGDRIAFIFDVPKEVVKK